MNKIMSGDIVKRPIKPLFRIGAQPLDRAEWIDVDDSLAFYLAEKERLRASCFSDIFVAEPDTTAVQREVLDQLVAFLPERFPEIYQRDGENIFIVPTGQRIALQDADTPPLWSAASLVQEDLLIMRRGTDGWRLVAGALCFPSAWRLSEKFGRAINDIHAPVPGFGAGTRNAQIIERMFDNLRPETRMVRWNWSIYGDDDLYHPEAENPGPGRFGGAGKMENVFLRAERQTLTRLAESRDILFTVRIYVDPLAALARSPDAQNIARDLAAALEALDADQLAYKGLSAQRDRLLGRVTELFS